VKAGRKGNLNVATEVYDCYLVMWNTICHIIVQKLKSAHHKQIFQVAPSLHMVEVRKAKGDTLEFHKVFFCLLLCLIALHILCLYLYQ